MSSKSGNATIDVDFADIKTSLTRTDLHASQKFTEIITELLGNAFLMKVSGCINTPAGISACLNKSVKPSTYVWWLLDQREQYRYRQESTVGKL